MDHVLDYVNSDLIRCWIIIHLLEELSLGRLNLFKIIAIR